MSRGGKKREGRREREREREREQPYEILHFWHGDLKIRPPDFLAVNGHHAGIQHSNRLKEDDMS